MIDLAPNHKQGLQLQNPIMIGGGIAGYGEALFPSIDPASLGALVAGPMMRYSSGGSETPRIAEHNGGFISETGWQNRGVSSALKRYGPLWSRLGCPIILQVADSHPEPLHGVVEKLNDALYQGTEISGIELVLPTDADENHADLLITTILRSTDLPLVVNLPLLSADLLADAAVYAGADALVVGRGPNGALMRLSVEGGENREVRGTMGGHGLYPLMSEKLGQIQKQDLGVPLIASGGIHSVGHAKHLLDSGATALQIGSAIWVEPDIVRRLVDAFG